MSWSDLAAWVSVTGNAIRAEELSILQKMDHEFTAAVAVERSAAIERMESKRRVKAS